MQVINETDRYRNKFQRGKANACISAINEAITELKNRKQGILNIETVTLFHLLDLALRNSEAIPLGLISDFVDNIILYIENAGGGLEFRIAIDQIISFYESIGRSTVDLYLSKIEYIRLTDTISEEKEKIIEKALQSTQNNEEKIRVQLKLIQYYIDTSQYRRSIKNSKDLLSTINQDLKVEHYLPKAHDLLGITYYYQFKLRKALFHLDEACKLSERLGDTHTFGEALHYIGRIRMEEGNYLQAMKNFIEANLYQQKNFADTAWFHLRMGVLLTKSFLLVEAQYHIIQAQNIFTQIKYQGSAWVQIELAWADLAKKQKQFDESEKHIKKAIKKAQSTGFFRGELLCLVMLFWLQLIKQKRLDKAIVTFFLAMSKREIWSNSGMVLILTYLSKVLMVPVKWVLKQKFSISGTVSFNTKVNNCECQFHNPTNQT